MDNNTNAIDNNTDIVVLTTKNPQFCIYLLCSSLLVLKMMGLTLLTILQRFKNKAFISDEDAAWLRGEVKINEKVERVRRALLNDMENIGPFIVIALMYLFTNPETWLVFTLFITFLVVRALHSFVYVIFVIRQPVRATLFGIGFFITGYMCIRIALHGFLLLL